MSQTAVEGLEAQLARTDYVAGDRFSMGDIPTGAAVYRWRVFGQWGRPMPHVDAWLARLGEREGFRRHVAPPSSTSDLQGLCPWA